MNPLLGDDAVAFGATAERAFDDAGGITIARRAEADPSSRSQLADLFGSLGTDALDPRVDADHAEAASVLCRAAGRVALPYPIESILLGDSEPVDATGGFRPFAVVPTGTARVDHGDLYPVWHVVTLDGEAATARVRGGRLATKLGPFCIDLTLDEPLTSPVDRAALALRAAWWTTLSCWRILGALEQAVALAARHTSERVQFDKPLNAFQTVRFALADAQVAVNGLDELARFTLWRLTTCPDAATADVLALRCHAVDVGREVLRATQHLHGAAGLCDDYDISILTRHLQPALRLPESADATARRLADEVSRHGFTGLFSHGGAA